MPNILNAVSPQSWKRRLRVAASCLAALAAVTAVHAQTDPAPAQAADPPARVGRISFISGSVTLTDYRANEESDASLNWPLTSQQRLTTGDLGRAEVRVGSTSVRLDGDTVLDFNRIDDDGIQLTLQRGSVALRLRNREQLSGIDFITPRERVVFEDVGAYRIDVDRTPGVSAVTAKPGTARVFSDQLNFVVQTGQRGEASAEPVPNFQILAPLADVFDAWVVARDVRDDSLQSTRYVSPETTGVESLDGYGEWRNVESYGSVWFPTTVVAGWAPYRYGRWAYIAPWGWTWIDAASWGFTPFHYGRWVYVHNTWGWVPGAYVARPCYAPALVAWYDSPGLTIGVGAPVGWFPLGPGEPFIPSYYHSRHYIAAVNYGHVTNINYGAAINSPPAYRYRQPNYSTWAPSDSLVRRTPINRVVQPAPNDWAKLPTMQHPPVKVTDDARRIMPKLVKAAPPRETPNRVMPPRDVARRPSGTPRAEVPGRIPATRERVPEREATGDAPNRPPALRSAPSEDRPVVPPVQRAPRTQVPRQEAPHGEIPAPPRPPKVQPIERTSPTSGQIAAPAQQFASRPAPRQVAPVQTIAPRPEPATRAEMPARSTGPRQHEQTADNAPHVKAPRQVEAPRS
ncbi:MAG TPA: DUF6600 domain-containing protein [Burkholderiaceae bacterium]|nr:DUF6600 domain-containing protein [Burkholderiaceae bacterium]